MEKKNFKYGLKLEGRFAGKFEVFTRDEVERLLVVFRSCRAASVELELFDNALLFDKLSHVFELND